MLTNCVQHEYKAEPVIVEQFHDELNTWSLDNAALQMFLQENNADFNADLDQVFSYKQLYLIALYYSPELQLAYEEWRKASAAIPSIDSRKNIEVNVPFDYNSRARSGDSPWTIGLILNLIYERKAKREARKTVAEVNAYNAYLQMQKIAYILYARIKQAYIHYLSAHAELALIEDEVTALEKLVTQLELKTELGSATQFEVSSIKLELQQRIFRKQLVSDELNNIKDKLLALTNINQAEQEKIKLEEDQSLLFFEESYASILNADVNTLQARLLQQHVDMALGLNSYALAEAELKLKIEEQYPDIVLSPGFVFEQSDNLWVLGTSWLLPLFKNTEQDRVIRIALQERKVQQKKILLKQKQLLSTFYLHYRSVKRYKKSLDFNQSVLDGIKQRADNIAEQVKLGGSDEVPLSRNRLEFLQASRDALSVRQKALNEIVALDGLLQDGLHTENNNNITEALTVWVRLKQEREENAVAN